jgi:hypothetical protein
LFSLACGPTDQAGGVPLAEREEPVDQTKPFSIAKREVWEAFKRVKANQGAAGVDGQSIADFEANLAGNLYKLWNRLSSGSYFPPPVRQYQDRDHAELIEVTQELMHLQHEKPLVRHRVKIAVQAVDQHHAGLFLLHDGAHPDDEFSR